MSDFIERMRVEYAELEEKIHKLNAFFHSQIFTSLPEVDRDLLYKQHRHMSCYSVVLYRRIARASGVEDA